MERQGRQGGWARKVLVAQVAGAAVLAFACTRSPLDADRYAGADVRAASGTGAASGSIDATLVKDVPPDDDRFQPPTHHVGSKWHVLDTEWGDTVSTDSNGIDIHRLATQWHNTLTQWWFWVPVTPPKWRGPYVGVAPADETSVGTGVESGETSTYSGSGVGAS